MWHDKHGGWGVTQHKFRGVTRKPIAERTAVLRAHDNQIGSKPEPLGSPAAMRAHNNQVSSALPGGGQRGINRMRIGRFEFKANPACLPAKFLPRIETQEFFHLLLFSSIKGPGTAAWNRLATDTREVKHET
jgi:hypothetical protein